MGNPSNSLDGARFSRFQFHSGLINGRGRFYNKSSPTPQVLYETPLDIIEVDHGQEYRFRVGAAGVIFPFRVSVQGHRMKLVASDGYNVDPLPVESLIINPGERYDFMLTADQPVDNYMIFAETLQTGMRVRTERPRVVLPILITTMIIIIMEVSVAWQLR